MEKKEVVICLRVPSTLKKELSDLASGEGRSLSQFCELLLRLGVEDYRKEGSRLMERALKTPHRRR
jgi:hypothetical protein